MYAAELNELTILLCVRLQGAGLWSDCHYRCRRRLLPIICLLPSLLNLQTKRLSSEPELSLFIWLFYLTLIWPVYWVSLSGLLTEQVESWSLWRWIDLTQSVSSDLSQSMSRYLNQCLASNFSQATYSKQPTRLYLRVVYLKPTEACQTNANSKKKIGSIGNTSMRGPKAR